MKSKIYFGQKMNLAMQQHGKQGKIIFILKTVSVKIYDFNLYILCQKNVCSPGQDKRYKD